MRLQNKAELVFGEIRFKWLDSPCFQGGPVSALAEDAETSTMSSSCQLSRTVTLGKARGHQH